MIVIAVTFHAGYAHSAPRSALPLPGGNQASAGTGVPGLPLVYQHWKQKSCIGAFDCMMAFPAAQTGYVLNATRLTCIVAADAVPPGSFDQVVIGLYTGDLDRPETVASLEFFVPPQDATEGQRFGINESISTFFRAGARPKLIASTQAEANFTFSCKLSGTLVQP